jgi:hypothetical protein
VNQLAPNTCLLFQDTERHQLPNCTNLSTKTATTTVCTCMENQHPSPCPYTLGLHAFRPLSVSLAMFNWLHFLIITPNTPVGEDCHHECRVSVVISGLWVSPTLHQRLGSSRVPVIGGVHQRPPPPYAVRLLHVCIPLGQQPDDLSLTHLQHCGGGWWWWCVESDDTKVKPA